MVINILRWWSTDKQTIGNCVIYDDDGKKVYSCFSLERGWIDNKRNISCIPVGSYTCMLEYSEKFKMYLWEVKGVDGRSEIKFHLMNYYYDSNGCIGLGRNLKDLNNDGYYDITNSKRTLKEFHKILKGQVKVKLIIK